MNESPCHESNLEINSCHYNADLAETTLLRYLQQNSKSVFDYHSERKISLRGFHKEGISIHVHTTYFKSGLDWKQPEIDCIGVRLVSGVTPTQTLEDTLKELVAPFKK